NDLRLVTKRPRNFRYARDEDNPCRHEIEVAPNELRIYGRILRLRYRTIDTPLDALTNGLVELCVERRRHQARPRGRVFRIREQIARPDDVSIRQVDGHAADSIGGMGAAAVETVFVPDGQDARVEHGRLRIALVEETSARVVERAAQNAIAVRRVV